MRLNLIRIAIALVSIATMAACSERRPVASENGAPEAKKTPPAITTGSAAKTSTLPPTVKRPGEIPTCYGLVLRNRPMEDLSRSWIGVSIDTARGFGPSCPEIAPGRECFIPLSGSWRLLEAEQGTMAIQVFEDADVKPAREVRWPVRAGGMLFKGAAIQYVPSKGTKTAHLFATLLVDGGKDVARTPEQTIPLPACDPTAG